MKLQDWKSLTNWKMLKAEDAELQRLKLLETVMEMQTKKFSGGRAWAMHEEETGTWRIVARLRSRNTTDDEAVKPSLEKSLKPVAAELSDVQQS